MSFSSLHRFGSLGLRLDGLSTVQVRRSVSHDYSFVYAASLKRAPLKHESFIMGTWAGGARRNLRDEVLKRWPLDHEMALHRPSVTLDHAMLQRTFSNGIQGLYCTKGTTIPNPQT